MILDWAVIGAGPAGIAAVGKLLDAGVEPKQIGWVDPHFAVGDLGTKWKWVPSNTKVALFLKFLSQCKSFRYKPSFKLDSLPPEENCLLQHVVEPLQWVTDHLKQTVHSKTDTAMALNLKEGCWQIKLKQGHMAAKKVILALGADPKTLSLSGPVTIPLETALNPTALSKICGSQDTVAVFGSSHSAFLVLANLHDLGVNTINFYRSPHRYALFLKDWILYDDTGLKGFTAEWARKHVDGTWPAHLKRVLVSDHTFAESLALCNKAIYAVGFTRRTLPVLEQFDEIGYDDRTGIIAPNLFGLGLAFPQAKFDPLGHLTHRVGLWKFMDYLNDILPIWLKHN